MLSGRAMARIQLGLACLALGVIVGANPQHFSAWSSWSGQATGGLLFGTFFGLNGLAGAWMALGFAQWTTRFWQSMALLALTVVGVLINGLLSQMPGSEIPAFAAVMGLIALGQYLLIATPLLLLFTRRRLGWRHVQAWSSDEQRADQQFGIGEMLIVTAGTGLLFGVLRLLVQSGPWTTESSLVRGLLIMGYLAACNVFVTLPLFIAPLLRRFALAATILALASIVVITACEIIAFHAVERNSSNERVVFWAMNYGQAMWVLLALGTLRAGGYRLAAATSATPTIAAAIVVNRANQS
jgi:hypothetical protein